MKLYASASGRQGHAFTARVQANPRRDWLVFTGFLVGPVNDNDLEGNFSRHEFQP